MRQRVILAALVASAACGPGSDGSSNAVTLSARLGSSAGTPGPVQASGIELSRVRASIRSLRVERKDSKTDVEIAAGPLLLDVKGNALAGSLLELVEAGVPAGTYDKLKLQVHRLSVAPSADFDDLIHRGASILLEGTIDGQPFTFSSALEAELEHEGEFELGATATNITLNLDPSTWFSAGDGSRLDPRVEGNRAAIEDNIRRSFTAFEDDDEDGFDDHGHRDGARPDGGVDDPAHHDGGDDGQHDGGQADAGDPGSGQPDAGNPGSGQPDAGQGAPDGGDDHGGGGGPGPGGGSDDGSGHG